MQAFDIAVTKGLVGVACADTQITLLATRTLVRKVQTCQIASSCYFKAKSTELGENFCLLSLQECGNADVQQLLEGFSKGAGYCAMSLADAL